MRKLAVFGAVLLAIVTVLMCWPAQVSAAPGAPTAPMAEPADPPAQPAAATAAVPVDPVTDAVAQRTEAPAPIARGPDFVLRGRCVDSWGRPVGGVTATLRGIFADRERMDAWTKDHGELQRIDAKTTTGNDGLFELRFWPPPPFQFSVDFEKAGLATMQGRWTGFEPGGSKDLGDIAMVRGTLLRGRVVDSDGVPVSKVDVQFASPQRDGEIAAFTADRCSVSSEDGSFTGRTALPAGTYRVEVSHRTLSSPKQLVLDGSVAEQIVEVVVAKFDDAAAIRGIVVDEREQ